MQNKKNGSGSGNGGRVLDEIVLTDDQLSKMFNVIGKELKAKKIQYEDILTFKQPFKRVMFVVYHGEYKEPARYVYKISEKEGKLFMYVYYDSAGQGEVGADGQVCRFLCNGDEIFSYYWNLYEGDAEDGDFLKRPRNENIVNMFLDREIQRDFLYMFFVTGFFIKMSNEYAEAGVSGVSGVSGTGGSAFVHVENSRVSLVEEVRDKKRGSGGGVRYKNVVYVNKVYSFSKIDKLSTTELRREFKCLCWGVRGHIRHVNVVDKETGEKKVRNVFVRPYLKGKKRKEVANGEEGLYEGKEYRL